MPNDRWLFSLVLWCFAGIALAVLLSSCSAAVPIPATLSAEPTLTKPAATNSPKQATARSTPTPRPICIVTAGRVYLRNGAGMSYAVLDVLRAGDELQIIRRGQWLKVKSPIGTGYVYSKFCK